jgi:hypothetical protein
MIMSSLIVKTELQVYMLLAILRGTLLVFLDGYLSDYNYVNVPTISKKCLGNLGGGDTFSSST